ncbi:hypothetical protein JUJ52_03470 [Virgibacillus sp. AGTR]|uniref:hypothetical protein n=1 Tax=Virgibacillus sp. AGTR TaxID=2812055 RepID=UPI001D15FDE6|nr:hypothetical protein [Virgibacillus sp. AGTR]MCC2249017.1 hypothetical protein [Virgibacillus sp. AGTR]
MTATVYDRLMHQAKGRRPESRHNKRENKQTTKLQNFLETVNKQTNHSNHAV